MTITIAPKDSVLYMKSLILGILKLYGQVSNFKGKARQLSSAWASNWTLKMPGRRGGFRGGSLEPLSGAELFHFYGEFQDILCKNRQTNPLFIHLNPPPEILDPPLGLHTRLLTSKEMDNQVISCMPWRHMQPIYFYITILMCAGP